MKQIELLLYRRNDCLFERHLRKRRGRTCHVMARVIDSLMWSKTAKMINDV